MQMVIKSLSDSSCKKCIISTSATYIWHTCENVKKWNSQQKIELRNSSEQECIYNSNMDLELDQDLELISSPRIS